MTAVQRIEHIHVIELRLVIPGLLGQPTKSPERLKVFEEPHQDPEEKPTIQPAETVVKVAEESRSLVELYEHLLSFRKGCATYWSEVVGPQAASYLLHHYVPAEGVAKMTLENYLQHEAILRKISAHVEAFSDLVRLSL